MMPKKLIGSLLLPAFGAMLFLGVGCQRFLKEDDALHLALVGPMTGTSAAVGKAFQQGVQLHLDAVNRNGGVNGRRVVLDIFDDQNNPELARSEAFKITQDENVLGVIGHQYSTCSIAAGDIYKEYGIPAISPASTNIRVTQDNPWYFRTSFNDNLQGRFLANYAHKVFGQPTVSIIYENDDYGSYLAEVFEKSALELGINIRYKWFFEPDDRNLDDTLERIVYNLKTKDDAGIIFMSTHAGPGIKLLKSMKDNLVLNPIMGPDAFASETFRKGFDVFPNERRTPGYYTDGMYVTTPLIFDTTNDKGQRFKDLYRKRYGETPGWHAAFAYDTAMLLVHAIKNGDIVGKPETLQEDRRRIRNFLASMTGPETAVEGVTGYNYFDANGDAQKPVLIGVYKNRNIISALTQFQTITNPAELSYLETTMEKDRVMLFNGQYMYRVNVVYTGMEINEITELDLKNLTCVIDFHLWFRYQGDIPVKDLIFTNAVEPVEMNEPIQHQKTKDDLNYYLYHLKGKFRIDFLPDEFVYGEHTLGVSFRHPELDRNNLIYVIDVLGMGKSSDEKALVERLHKHQVLSPATRWKLKRISFFQDTVEESSMGNPDYLNILGGMADFSRFNLAIQIVPDAFILRNIIPPSWVNYMLVCSIVLIFLLPVIARTRFFNPYVRIFWLLQLFATFLLLLSAEYYLINILGRTFYITPIILIFNILWWIISATLFNTGVKRFVWMPLESRTGRSVPQIIQHSTAFFVYLLAIFGIVAFVFDQRLTSLLATSGVIAMIIGLAVQINIANIFSGIAINVERPFRVGDWVKIGEFKEGKVIDINWRTTRIKTRDETVLCVPNSQASESPIENFSIENNAYAQYFTIHVDHNHPPERVKKILLDAALATDLVEKEPPPITRFLGLTAGINAQSESWAANYLVGVFVKDYGKKFAYNEAIWFNIWTHLKRAGIRPIIQRQEMHMVIEGIRQRKAIAARSLSILDEIDIFRAFSAEDKRFLSKRMRSHHYFPGQAIVHQGDTGNSLFIIEEGVVSVRVKFDTQTKPREVARIGAGNVFGEMALLTGERRMATVVSLTETHLYEITKDDIAPLLEQEPHITKVLSDILGKRKMATEAQRDTDDEDEFDKDNFATQLFNKIQTFFGFKRL